jgi:hypothetical protein
MRGLVSIALFVSACSGPSVIDLVEPGLPEGAAWIGAVGVDEGGAIATSSGLARISEGEASRLFMPSGDLVSIEIYSYSETQISSVAATNDPSALWSGRLEEAGPMGRPLPSPLFSERYTKDGTPMGAPPMRALTASWVVSCPRVFDPSMMPLVDASCSPNACLGTASQEACRIEIDTASCRLGELSGTVGSSGAVSLDPAAFSNCTAIAARPPALLSLACESSAGELCSIDLYSPGAAEVITATTVKVEPDARPFPEIDRPVLYVGVQGYLQGLAVLERELVVATSGDRVTVWPFCDPAIARRFRFLDLESLEVVRTATAPPCLTALAKDPGGDGFIATYGGDQHRIGRFDPQGNLRRFVQVDDPRITGRHLASTMYVTQDPARIVVVYSWEGPGAEVLTYLVALDPATLAVMRTSSELRGVVMVIGSAGPNRAIFSDTTKDDVHLLDLRDLTVVQDRPLRSECNDNSGIGPISMWYHPATDRVLVAATDNASPTMFFLSPDATTRCDRANFFETLAEGTAIAPWPADPSRMLLAVMAPRDSSASLALVEVAGRRVLPGSTPVGIGPAAHFAARGERLYFTLPWTASVGRAEPAL